MKTIKLLLTENVEHLGIVGDVVNVKPGFARNYLIPHSLATDPSAGNIARLAGRRAQVESELKVQRAALEAMLGKIEGQEITIERSANEQGVLFGSVSPQDIADALAEQGLKIAVRAVRVNESIKRLDTYEIPIVLADELHTTIKLWVVSDKPSDQLDADDQEEGESGVRSPESGVPSPESPVRSLES